MSNFIALAACVAALYGSFRLLRWMAERPKISYFPLYEEAGPIELAVGRSQDVKVGPWKISGLVCESVEGKPVDSIDGFPEWEVVARWRSRNVVAALVGRFKVGRG